MTFKTPILILCYNRPDKLKKLLNILSIVKPQRVYFNCDGPKNNNDDKKNIQKVKQIIKNYESDCLVFSKFHPSNLGCKSSVQSGLDFFFKHEKMGIILEDDCIPNLFFFKYCSYLLKKFKNNRKIFAISGFNLLDKKKFSDGDYFLSKYFLCWGWATWKRSWTSSSKKISFWPRWKKNNFLLKYHKNILEAKYWTKILSKTYRNKIDTWDYAFLASMWKQNAFCILPNYNLVRNIGFDKSASHTRYALFKDASKLTESQKNIKDPSSLTCHDDSDKILINQLFKIQNFFYPRRFCYIIKIIFLNFYEKFNN
jgi:hypothetical protein